MNDDDVIIAANETFHALETGPLYWFSDWPIADVPRSGATVYTIWDRGSRFNRDGRFKASTSRALPRLTSAPRKGPGKFLGGWQDG
jgi:hypothetical protein